MAKTDSVKVDVTTGLGTLSFPHVFASTKSKNDKGEDVYDIQIIIPKEQREDIRALLRAIKQVGEAKWGDNWKKMRQPLRDGDKEKDEFTEDGATTKGEKYPERIGCYFLNARSYKPVGVYDRLRNPITNPDELYGGCKGKIAVTFFPYSQSGNHGIGAGLQGVQKVSDGEAFGNARPSVESMFDLIDDDDLDIEDEVDEVVEETPPPAKKAAAKKAAPAKKAAAKKAAAAEPVEVDEDDDLGDAVGDDEDDLFDDLD